MRFAEKQNQLVIAVHICIEKGNAEFNELCILLCGLVLMCLIMVWCSVKDTKSVEDPQIQETSSDELDCHSIRLSIVVTWNQSV